MRSRVACISIAVCLEATASAGQIVGTERRGVVFGEVGYARTWDDEGLLGQGGALAAGVGLRVAPRVTVQAVLDRISYHRDVEWLAFDGRVIFAGVETLFHSTRPAVVRPFFGVAVGVFNDDGVWIQKTFAGPLLPRREERVARHYTLAALSFSGGFDSRVSERIAIRTSLRLHGLLDTGQDLAPHIIIRPGVGAVWRW